MRNKIGVLVALWILGVSSWAAAAELSPVVVGKEWRCPVCGMYPARYPKWMGQIVFNDSSAQAFDSPLEMLTFLNDMAKFDARHRPADVGMVFVSDYAKGGWVDAQLAFFAVGSKARGPMGEANFPAFASKDMAENFVRQYGGAVAGWAELRKQTVGSGSHAAAHHH